MDPITVLVVLDEASKRGDLRKMLAAEPGIVVVGEEPAGLQAVQQAGALRPGVVLMDIRTPGSDGLAVARSILGTVPGTRVLVLCPRDGNEFFCRVQALGAAGYLPHGTPAPLLIRAIREAWSGNTFFCPSVSRRVGDRRRGDGRASAPVAAIDPSLTPREVDVLRLVAAGGPNKQIAAELGISVKTVDKHRQSLMKKLDLHTPANLTRYAIVVGLVKGTPPGR